MYNPIDYFKFYHRNLYLNRIRNSAKRGLKGRMLRTSFTQKVLDTFYLLNGYSFIKEDKVSGRSEYGKMGGYLEYIVLLPVFSYLMQVFDKFGENSSSISAQILLGILHALAFLARCAGGVITFFTSIAVTLLATIIILPVAHEITRRQAKPYKHQLYELQNDQGMTLRQFLDMNNCSISKMKKMRTDFINFEFSFFARNGRKFVIKFPDREQLRHIFSTLHELGLIHSRYSVYIDYVQQTRASQESEQSNNGIQHIASKITRSRSKQQENQIINKIQNLLNNNSSTIHYHSINQEANDNGNGTDFAYLKFDSELTI